MEQQDKKYQYFAFISYKHEDEKWAKWLQKKLESYNLPTALRKEHPNLPSKIRPVFRDQSDLSGGNLKVEIEKALNASKHLIVICSPRSAKSPWVSKEVQHFIQQCREEYIIPFIISGTPNSNKSEDECFPDGLRQLTGEKEILGININEMGREAAVIKIIARMFNLKFDSLWQRYEKAKKRTRFLIGFVGIIFILVSLVIIGHITRQNKMLEQAHAAIELQQDSIRLVNKGLVIANDSLRLAKERIIISQDSLQKTNEALCKSNFRLNEANIKLAHEKQIIIEQDKSVLEKSLSLLITSANEQFACGEYLKASEIMADAIELYEKRGYAMTLSKDAYELAIRKVERIWHQPGIHLINSICLDETTYGTFIDDEIVIPQARSLKFWDYTQSRNNNNTIRTSYNTWNTYIAEKLDYIKAGKYLEHNNGILKVVNVFNNKTIGKPLDIGYSWLIKYKFSNNANNLIILKDSTIIRYDYFVGTADTLIKTSNAINSFIESPINANVLAILTADSCISLFNCKTKVCYKIKKIGTKISSLSYHPNGHYLVAAGENITLLNSSLDILYTYTSNLPLECCYTKFNDDGTQLYTRSISSSGEHSVWSIGYLPIAYSLLSSNGKYGVKYNKKKDVIYDFENKTEVPGLSTNENEHFQTFGSKNISVLKRKRNVLEKCYDFELCDLNELKKYPLRNFQLKSYDRCFVIDETSMVYITNKDTIFGINPKNGNIYTYNGKNIIEIKYSPYHKSLFTLSKGIIYKTSDDLSHFESFLGDVSNIKRFDIDNNGNIYILDSKGYLYYINSSDNNKKYIAVVDDVTNINVDPDGKYILTHYSYHPKYDFSLEVQPFGYNIISNTKIWDIENQTLVDDLSGYFLTSAKLIRNYNGNLLIDTGKFWIPIDSLSTLEKRILKRHKRHL